MTVEAEHHNTVHSNVLQS